MLPQLLPMLTVKIYIDCEFWFDLSSSNDPGFCNGLKEYLDAGLGLHLNNLTFFFSFFLLLTCLSKGSVLPLTRSNDIPLCSLSLIFQYKYITQKKVTPQLQQRTMSSSALGVRLKSVFLILLANLVDSAIFTTV